MDNKLSFSFDPESGISVCNLRSGQKLFQGFAFCREEDRDMMSQYTGQTIAEMRALISRLVDYRDNVVKPGLKALNDYKYMINQSRHFNEDSYEYRMLERKIKQYEDELEDVKEGIKTQKEWLNGYMKSKAKTWEKIRQDKNK